MASEDNKNEWENLKWKEKVQICQQGIAAEDSLLISYVVIFVALEATFAAFVISKLLCLEFDIAISVLGIVLAIIFMLVCKRRGDIVDRWGSALYSLWDWDKVPDDTISVNVKLKYSKAILAKAIREDYEGCMERLNIGWKAIFCGWPTNEKHESPLKSWSRLTQGRSKFLFTSARRLTIAFCPILVIVVWTFVLYRLVAH
jgi:hypothetical protein